MAVISRVIIQALPLYDNVKTKGIYLSLSQELTLTSQIKKVTPYWASPSDMLAFDQHLTARILKANYVLTDSLNLTQRVGRVIEVDVRTLIQFESGLKKPDSVSQFLTLTETVTATNSKFLIDQINFTSKGNYTHRRSKSANNIITFISSVNYIRIPKGINPTRIIYTDPIVFTQAKSFIIGGLTLRSPVFQNTFGSIYRRIQHESRGRTLILAGATGYQDKRAIKTFKVSFNYLKQEQVKDLLNIVESRLGKSVSLIDHEGRNWSVMITNPEVEVVQQGRHNFATSLDLEIL